MHFLIKPNAQKQTKQIKCEINTECGLVNIVFMDSCVVRSIKGFRVHLFFSDCY